MFVYVVMPILEKSTEVANLQNKYWLGKEYHKRISNGLSNQEKDDKYDKFIKQVQEEFSKTNFENFTYLEVIGNTNEHSEFIKALLNVKPNPTNNDIFFKSHTESFEDRNRNKFAWILGSLGIGFLIVFIILLFSKFQRDKLTNFRNVRLKGKY